MEDWKNKHYSFCQNKECEFFPCHPTEHPEDFNCLFCYCPLYVLGDRCCGNFTYLENGFKDCSGCLVPHKRSNYGKIIDRFAEVAELAKKQ